MLIWVIYLNDQCNVDEEFKGLADAYNRTKPVKKFVDDIGMDK